MRTLVFRALVGVCLLTGHLLAAPPHPSTPIYPQIVCVVPIIGAGTVSDPRRPMFAPVIGQEENSKASKGFLDPATITSFRSVPTDDGLFAIVVFEAHDRAAFRSILGSRSLLKSFDLATTPVDTLLPALRIFKKDLDLRFLQGGAL